MSGDYSRLTFDPAQDYEGVLLQQGRPLTDADWNGLVGQHNRRIQAGAYDTFGADAVVPLNTPDGFKLALAGGQFSIGRGRIYVDGLLAENHGMPPVAWDPALAEPYGAGPVPYDQQPYWPAPAPLPTGTGPHLVYVDVWRREVTQFQAPALVDQALGIDTTTRLQTVWQVKVLANDQGASLTCDTDPASIPGWAALTAPSAGRLSTATASFGESNPCLIPPSGGYTGLENQLYRVEIHDGGAPGTATFKWSRDNASVETRVSAFTDASTLVVESVGKDGVLRFKDGDWIEVLDDWLELAGAPGELHRIVLGGGVDDATRTITLDTPVTAGRFNEDPSRHTRIRRWDQGGQVLRTDTATPTPYVDLGAAGATGAIIVPEDATAMIGLESGIAVSFAVSASGGVFKPGDWWVFAARSADASVELLDHAPPRGIHHHCARLGLFTPGSQPTDCRQFWPPATQSQSCDCTICVSPAAHAQSAPSLQQAIETLVSKGGGTLCLEIGDYMLRAPLRVEGARSLTLRGQGEGTHLIAQDNALTIVKSSGITLERFTVRSGAETVQSAFAAISADSVRGLRIQQLTVLLRGANPANAGIAISGAMADLRLGGNLITAPVGLAGGGSLTLRGLRVEDNALHCAASGIKLLLAPESLTSGSQGPLQVLRNDISQCAQVGVEVTGAGVADVGLEVAGNRLAVAGSGIAAGLTGVRITGNDIAHAGEASAAKLTFGIVLTPAHAAGLPPGDGHLTANRIQGFSSAGILVQAALGRLQIKQNQIGHCGAGIEVGGSAAAELLSIENNQLSDIGTGAGQARVVGIGVAGVYAVTVAANAVVRLGAEATAANTAISAIQVQGSGPTAITGNELSEIGPKDAFFGTATGILVQAPAGAVSIEGNRIRRDAQAHAADASLWFGIVVFAQVQAAGAAIMAVPQTLQRFVGAASAAPGPAPGPSATASVRGNVVAARGGAHAVAVMTSPTCEFSGNQCTHTASGSTGTQPDVLLAAPAVIAANNRIAGPKGPSLALQTQEGHFTVLGNVTSGEILVQNAALAAPWAALNAHAPP